MKSGILEIYYYFGTIARTHFYLTFTVSSILITLAINNIESPYLNDIVLMVFFYAAMGLAWNIVGGFCGQISLGHVVFFGIGGYCTALMLLRLGITPWVSMIIGAFISAIIGFLIGIITLRLKGPYFTLTTIALGEIALLLSNYFEGFTGGSVGLILPREFSIYTLSFANKKHYSIIAFFMMIAMICLSRIIRNSKWGYYFHAIKDAEDAAGAIGVPGDKYKIRAFVISAFCTSIGGSFYICYLHYADPDVLFTLHHSIQFALIAVIGGTGTVVGPVIGSIFITPIDSIIKSYLGGQMQGLSSLVYGIVLILVVLFMPRGITFWIKGILNNYHLKDAEKAKEIPANISVLKDIFSNDNSEPILKVEKIKKTFGGLVALDDISFEVEKGEILGIIGPNGAGKTTLFNTISRSLNIDHGKIYFKSNEVSQITSPSTMSRLGLSRTFQIPKPFNSMNVVENVTVGAFNQNLTSEAAFLRARAVVDFVGLKDRTFHPINGLTVADLKRLELAKALATSPELILLDEVMTGLTIKESDELIDLIYKIQSSGVTIIAIEHVMRSIMKISQRIIVLNYGKLIAEGKPIEIRNNNEVITAYLGKTRCNEYAAT